MPPTACSRCGATWPENYQFCGRCGQALHHAAAVAAPAPPPPAPPPGRIPPPPAGPAPTNALQPAQIRLVVLRGAVTEGTTYDLQAGLTVIGRSADLSFAADPLMSARHIVLDRSPDTLDLTQVPGTSGCYRRTREPVVVRSGDVVFAGEQYLLVRTGADVPADEAPTGSDLPPETFGTPLPPPRLHVTQLLAGGLPGRVVSTEKDVLTVGRENCDLSFPQDRFMSGRHLRLEASADGDVQVVDVGSLNGTFVRVADMPVRLAKGDELLVGQMLFRVDIKVEG